MTCAQRMKEIIDETGRRQDWIAAQMQINPDRLSRILKGKLKLTADELIAFCTATQTDLREFAKATA